MKQQYEGESAYCLAESLIHAKINSIEIAVSENQSIYKVNKLKKSLSINAANCSVSPFQLVDISKCLAFIPNITHLELNFAGNWQLSYTHIKRLIQRIPYFSLLVSLKLNVSSVFIYEVEYITLYLSLLQIPFLEIEHDF